MKTDPFDRLPPLPLPWNAPNCTRFKPELESLAVREDGRHVYRVDGDLLVKIFARPGHKDARRVWRREHRALRALDGAGFAHSHGCRELTSPSGRRYTVYIKEFICGEAAPAIGEDELREIARLLAKAHRRRVLIQDPTLNNLVRRPNGRLVFVDFGSAHVFWWRGLIFSILLGKEWFKLLRDILDMDQDRFARFRSYYDAATPELRGWRRRVAEISFAWWLRRSQAYRNRAGA